MGTDNQVDKLTTCLIGLVIGAFMLAGPQSGWAQEGPGGTPVQEEDESESAASKPDDSGTEEAQPEASDSEEQEAADASEETETAESEASETEAGATDGGAGAAEATEASAETGADAAHVAETSSEDGTIASGGAAASETNAADGVGTASENVLENAVPAPIPARARDPITGASEPFEYEPAPADDDAEEAAEEEFITGEEDVGARDPLEGMNRAFFQFNDFLDKLLLKPTAEVYRFVLPSYLQDRVRNVVNNADSPVILANDILQWKWNRAWNTTSRFFINTTLGVAGIWDVAASFGIERHEEDFGQTLCVWGVGEWFYLYLPFVGPTNPRDMVGKGVDRFFDPLTYYADVVQQVNLSDGVDIKFNIDRAGMAQLSLTVADLIDMRARNIETINEIERTSIDFYTAVRSLYRQSRESACNDGQVDFEDLPDLSDEFE